jgi:hypothetical protein
MRFFLLFFIFTNYFLNTSNSFLLKNSMMMISDNNYFDIKLFTKNLIDKKGFVILSNKNNDILEGTAFRNMNCYFIEINNFVEKKILNNYLKQEYNNQTDSWVFKDGEYYGTKTDLYNFLKKNYLL